jgi:methionine-rich copper-binding protein CopC
VNTRFLIVFGGLLLATLVLSPARVSAHADYDRSVPARDEIVPARPAQVDVWFTQEVFKQEGANFVRVFSDAGVQVSDGDGEYDDDDRTHIFATLPPDLADGRYVVRWMTTSDADGETDDGALCFYVVVAPSPEQQAECAAFAEEEEEPMATAGTTVEPTAAPTADDTPPPEDGDGGSTRVIVGAIVGVVAAVLLAGAAYALWQRRRT